MNLAPEEIKLFYKLRFALLAYTNRHLNIIPGVTAADEIGRQPGEKILALRDALNERMDLLERFVAENPEGFSDEELAIVASWRHQISGDFYIMRYLKSYTVFMNARGDPHLYGVLALFDPIEKVVRGAPLPLLVQATLLPFRGRIVYDGLLSPYRVQFGRNFSASLNQQYNRLKEREGIIEQLVGPSGEPQIRTSLDRKAPRKPAQDWRPIVDNIVAETKKLRPANTRLQGAAFGLLRAAASVAQASLLEQDAEEEVQYRLRSLRAALTKLENLLYEEMNA